MGVGGGLECAGEVFRRHFLRAGLVLIVWLCWAEVHAHEEAFGGGIAELRRIDDIEVVLDQETGHRVDDARSVCA